MSDYDEGLNELDALELAEEIWEDEPTDAEQLLMQRVLTSDWLAAHVAKAKAEAFDAVLTEADEGIEFGPVNMILLHRVVNRAVRSTR